MAAPLMLGVEEEFQLADPRSLDLSSGYDRLMRRAIEAYWQWRANQDA
jgi:hypothetical protein